MKLTISGIDFAWGTVDAAAVKKAGFKFGIAYLSHDTTGKNWSPSRLKAFTDAGLAVGFVWESASGRALQGFAAGKADAAAARAQSQALGFGTAPIAFAVDFDATDVQKPAIAGYFRGVAAVLGTDKTGAYGSYYIVGYLAARQVCGFYWQTYAWSGGKVHPEACVLQYSNGQHVAGLSVDYDHAAPEAFGKFLVGSSAHVDKRRTSARKTAVWRHHLHELQDVQRFAGKSAALKAAAHKLRVLIVR